MAKTNLIDAPGFEIGAFQDYGNPWGGVEQSVYVEPPFVVFEVQLTADTPAFLYGAQRFSASVPFLSVEVVGADFSFDGLPVQGAASGGVLVSHDVYPPEEGFGHEDGGLMTEVPRLPDGASGAPAWHYLHGDGPDFPFDWGASPSPETLEFTLGRQLRRGFTSGGPVTARMRLHIEVEYDAPPDPDPPPDPAPLCFWTDLVNVHQHCAPPPPPATAFEWVSAEVWNSTMEVRGSFAPPVDLQPGPGEDKWVDMHDVPSNYGGGIFVTDEGAVFLLWADQDYWPYMHTRVRFSASLYRAPDQGEGAPGYLLENMEYVQDLPQIEGEMEVPPGWEWNGLNGRFVLPVEVPPLEAGYVYLVFTDHIETATPTGDFEHLEWQEIVAGVVVVNELRLEEIPYVITDQYGFAHDDVLYTVGVGVAVEAVENTTSWETVRWTRKMTVGGLGYAPVCEEFQLTIGDFAPIEGWANCA